MSAFSVAVIAALFVIALSLVALAYFIEESNAAERRRMSEAYERTLQTMADRIQAPDRLPVRDTQDFQIPEQGPDEWAQVGTIEIDPKYGLGDENQDG